MTNLMMIFQLEGDASQHSGTCRTSALVSNCYGTIGASTGIQANAEPELFLRVFFPADKTTPKIDISVHLIVIIFSFSTTCI